jgi:hypothetical protein
MELNIFGDWVDPQPIQAPPQANPILYDGHTSPTPEIQPAKTNTRRSSRTLNIVGWDEKSFTVLIEAGGASLSHKVLNGVLMEWAQAHPRIDFVKVRLSKGFLYIDQQIFSLTKLGFVRAGIGSYVYVRDMTVKRESPKPEALEPKPEPKELGWLETELKIVTDAIESRRALGVHESFLAGLLSEQAGLQKQVDEQNSVKDTDEWKELCRQEEEIEAQIRSLQARKDCPPREENK